MAKVVNGLNDAHRILRIDPKIAMETIRNVAVQSPNGLLSPSYPKGPRGAIGSILQTPVDTTPTRVEPEVKLPSSIGSAIPPSPHHLPKVPQREQLFNYGMVAPAESRFVDPPQRIRDFVADLPPLEETIFPPQATPEQKVDEAKKRADYRVKFSILREAYPHMNIPEPGDNQPVPEIEVVYKQYVKRIHIDSSVEQNKIYLLILWLIIEVVGCRFLRLPLSGYTKNQFNYMSKYQMLLIELGERSYSTSLGDGWPVELRLLAMAAFNGVIFVLVQMLAKKVGVNGDGAEKMAEGLRETINNFLTQNRGVDVLRRAEEADADHPPPPAPVEDNSPPLGGLGNLIATFAPFLSGMGLNTGGGAPSSTAEKPQMKKPTTFGARRNRPAEPPTTS